MQDQQFPNPAERPENTSAGKPPVFNSWKGWYTLVIGTLVLLMTLFYLLTQLYA